MFWKRTCDGLCGLQMFIGSDSLVPNGGPVSVERSAKVESYFMYNPREHSDLGELSADTATLSGPES